MNLQLDDVALFHRIVELGSLSAAARERSGPVSQVTRSLARLEAVCQTRLLHRDTHGLSLTDEGDSFAAHARRLLDTAAELHGELSGKRGQASGWVRVSVSPLLAQTVIAPSLASLYARHPLLHVDINADDRVVDMAREGIDVAIRTGVLDSEQWVARPIGTMTRSLYASPDYLALHGRPLQPDDLRRHRLIASSASVAINRWTQRSAPSKSGEGQARTDYLPHGHTRTDNSAVMVALVLSGAGIARLIDFVAQPLVGSGQLVSVMPEHFQSDAVPMFAMMLQERHRLPKIRACIDHWAAWLDAPVAR